MKPRGCCSQERKAQGFTPLLIPQTIKVLILLPSTYRAGRLLPPSGKHSWLTGEETAFPLQCAALQH